MQRNKSEIGVLAQTNKNRHVAYLMNAAKNDIAVFFPIHNILTKDVLLQQCNYDIYNLDKCELNSFINLNLPRL